jgi:gliding motility associated protien GldN
MLGFIKHSLLATLTCLCFISVHAQVQNPQPLREADALYNKRIWRIVELRERQNKIAMWPPNPLVKVLYDGLSNGTLRAYKNDSLTSFFDLEQFFKIGADTFLVRKLINPNSDDDLYTVDTVIERFNPVERIKQLLLLEEVYFDARTSQQRTQIIAIAPLYQKQIVGVDLGFIPLCWLKYFARNPNEKDARSLLATSYMYNNGNPYQKFSYYNWFEQRNFSGFVVKESNPYDIFIMDDPEVKRNGLDALIRAGYSKQQTMEQDHDMYEH